MGLTEAYVKLPRVLAVLQFRSVRLSYLPVTEALEAWPTHCAVALAENTPV